ncbi:MAG: alpha/beta hydrolase family protein [Gammaproteobacteria bacterium]
MWNGDISKTAYLFYQGKDSSQAQACKYTGNKPMLASTGEKVTFGEPGIDTIPAERLWVYPEIAEIDRQASFSILSRIKHWFRKISVTRDEITNKNEYLASKTDPEKGSINAYDVRSEGKSLGQQTDIAAHKAKYEALNQQNDIENVVLYGVSRGAATTFAALADHADEYKKVKLCILEAPPASIGGIVKQKSNFLYKLLYKGKQNWLVSFLFGKQHKTDKKEQATGYVERFPKHVPLLIVSSRKDTEVPQKNSMKLALRVAVDRIKKQQQGEAIEPVYFLQLDEPNHNDYARKGKFLDAEKYQNFVSKIYGAHELPKNQSYANIADNNESMRVANLTGGVLKDQVLFQAKFKETKDTHERQEIRKKAFNSLCETLTSLSPREKERVVKICLAMPLYHKHLNKWNAFGKTEVEVALVNLLKPARFPVETKSSLSTLVDYVNRSWFEGFFDFFLHPEQTWFSSYAFGFLPRLIALPMTATVYAISRIVAVVLNPIASEHNKAKAFLMRAVTGVSVTASALLGYFFINTTMLENVSRSLWLPDGFGGPFSAMITGAIFLGVSAVIGLASLLLGAKKTAQAINAEKISGEVDTYVTAPKHCKLITSSKDVPLNDYMIEHENALREHYQAKKPAICGSGPTSTTKPILTKFEVLTEMHHRGDFIESQLDDLNTALGNKKQISACKVDLGRLVPNR